MAPSSPTEPSSLHFSHLYRQDSPPLVKKKTALKSIWSFQSSWTWGKKELASTESSIQVRDSLTRAERDLAKTLPVIVITDNEEDYALHFLTNSEYTIWLEDNDLVPHTVDCLP
ncbi:uncharacterized protein ARMOST_08229 [Armillaria ostoyae]|uniref:Uncharacterized protein n=1 Tax=Armillaria ostoyae TaxID=47428 RepID=A0A284R811_ARMOS|nr:uncharacterized protein ARMOST_08229 [Armillaria ostoyae]